MPRIPADRSPPTLARKAVAARRSAIGFLYRVLPRSAFTRLVSAKRTVRRTAMRALAPLLRRVGPVAAAIRYRSRGLVPGELHDDYVRFVILSNARNGSNLLVHTLDQHPQIACDGEVLLATGPPGTNSVRDIRSRWICLIRDVLPEWFLENVVFCPMPREIKAAGFKIFAFQATDERFASTFHTMANAPGTRIIRLRRDNKLAVHLSLKRAEQSDQWTLLRTEPEATSDPGPMYLDPAACESRFEHLVQNDEIMDGFCRDREHLRLSYEELQTDLASALRRVQEYLGVDVHPLIPATRKQGASRLHEGIRNYDELKRHFAGTRWASFFD